MIYVTGDIHGEIDIGKLSNKNFPEQKKLTKNDYLIICGDFGLVWQNSNLELYWRKWLSNKNFTTLWIDGNHENFNLLAGYKTTKKFGGDVKEISPDVYHLGRGQIFTIDGYKIFTMGGAVSQDKVYRKENISWWAAEVPSKEEMETAINNLNKVDWSVDYVFTHCAPYSIHQKINCYYENDSVTSFLEFIYKNLNFKKWYFGHYHVDVPINKNFVALYDNIIPIGD